MVADARADFIGVILARKGPRQQSIESALPIYESAGELARVGVFADQPLAEITHIVEHLGLDIIQLHGSETSSFINELECETDAAIWKMISLKAAADLTRGIDDYADAVDGILLDSSTGGSGQRFDWELARDARVMLPSHVQLIVAGGLNPENVRDVVAYLKPDVVDVASGVEERVGEKSRELVHSFIRNANHE